MKKITGPILDHLLMDIPPQNFTSRNQDLMSTLLTCKTLNLATLNTLYKHVTIPHSRVFRKFLQQITRYPALGLIVRRLDFSHFNPTGSGITAKERALMSNLTAQTLAQCLKLMPNLKEFLAQEHIDDDMNDTIFKMLFHDLPRLEALDLCASSSKSFTAAFQTTILDTPHLPAILPIKRLSLHECTALKSEVFDALLPHLPHLTHLDVAHTSITSGALSLIPKTARLTHLNLAKCAKLDGSAIIDFLSTHPACENLVYLNIMANSKSHEFFDEDAITSLLPILPRTLLSLNLVGSKMDSSHIPLLLPLTKHLEELGLGRNLTVNDICKFYDVSEVATCHLRFLDLSSMNMTTSATRDLLDSYLMRPWSAPLEVIEVGEVTSSLLGIRPWVVKDKGWEVRGAGRRTWVVRDKAEIVGGGMHGDGSRPWKMGARFWGMRKVNVGVAEVGGMYGLYMFKR
jgi:hypothetical protein